MEAVGWASAALLAMCAFPQTIKSLRTRRASDLSWMFLLMWFGGEVLGTTYLWGAWDRIPILVNYAANAALLVPIIVVKATER